MGTPPTNARERRRALQEADAALEARDIQALLACLPAALGDEVVLETVHSLVRGLAQGRRVQVTVTGDLLSPTEAAARIGVSRTLVRKMMDRGDLPFVTKPASDHRLIAADDVARLEAQHATWAALQGVAATAASAAAERGLEPSALHERIATREPTEEDRERVATLMAAFEDEDGGATSAASMLPDDDDEGADSPR